MRGSGLSDWSVFLLGHELEGHIVGGCNHINGSAGADLMRSSTPWGPRMTDCAPRSFPNAAYLADHWPGPALLTATEPLPDLADGLALFQNYPNPFLRRTTLDFALVQAEHVRLRVFDMLGREVATLVDGMRPAGQHSVAFASAGLPPGVYFYQLTAGSHQRTRTMILHQP